MSERFFVEQPIEGALVEIDGPEAHHLISVMRAKVGDEVVLFDGTGAEFPARIRRIQRSRAELDVLERRVADRELPRPLHLGVALPKGDRQKWLIEKMTELGVTRVIPLETRRSVAQPVEKAVERLRRSVVEASKQCGRNRLMEISSAQPLELFLAGAPADALRLVAHPGQTRFDFRCEIAQPVYVAVGPEGGFTQEEVAQALALGWQSVDLGPRILRVETAATALAAWLSFQALATSSGGQEP